MSYTPTRSRQLVDWRAAFWAGILSGTVLLLLNLFLTPHYIGGNGWVIVRLFASILLGKGVLAPPATFDLAALITALFTHLTLSILYALILAYIIHRGGLITGILGGAVFGLALYLINFYTLTLFFKWFFAMESKSFLFNHIIYGALAGGTYEALEIEVFEPIYEEPLED